MDINKTAVTILVLAITLVGVVLVYGAIDRVKSTGNRIKRFFVLLAIATLSLLVFYFWLGSTFDYQRECKEIRGVMSTRTPSERLMSGLRLIFYGDKCKFK